MQKNIVALRAILFTLVLGSTLIHSPKALACGGFFCTTVPIDQAGEQIVFNQNGSQITAMVRILYTGSAEDFSWVVPVPSTPEISLGSDLTFTELDRSTRPQFLLEQNGQVCEKDQNLFPVTASPDAAGGAEDDDGVTIEEELTVGPFDIDIVSSDNAEAMAIWLQDNNYQIDENGRALLQPYVLAGMKFVAMKLRNGEDTGSIQPIIMQYQSDKPMVPIRLTAIAATPDMGVLVWVVNNSRAIPENYEHVIPNYTRLNWYAGSFNAYASYQALITDAMNEAGGQGFATDYAGLITDNIHSSMTQTAAVQQTLDDLNAIDDDATFISESLIQSRVFNVALAQLQNLLPLRDEESTQVYFEPDTLRAVYTSEELTSARATVSAALAQRELEPIANSTNLLPQDAYLTRLYTTLSADEMSVDPTFNYNTGMPDRPINREASLNASCENNVSEWTLTLGEGTGRNGEVVIRAIDQPIPFQAPPMLADEPAAFERQNTSADASPEVIFQATASTVDIAADGSSVGGSNMNTIPTSDDDDDGFLGASGPIFYLLAALLAIRSRRLDVKPRIK